MPLTVFEKGRVNGQVAPNMIRYHYDRLDIPIPCTGTTLISTKQRAIDQLKNAVVFGLSDFKFPSFFRSCEFVYVLLVGVKSIKMNQLQASSLSMSTSSEPFLGIPELKGK